MTRNYDELITIHFVIEPSLDTDDVCVCVEKRHLDKIENRKFYENEEEMCSSIIHIYNYRKFQNKSQIKEKEKLNGPHCTRITHMYIYS